MIVFRLCDKSWIYDSNRRAERRLFFVFFSYHRRKQYSHVFVFVLWTPVTRSVVLAVVHGNIFRYITYCVAHIISGLFIMNYFPFNPLRARPWGDASLGALVVFSYRGLNSFNLYADSFFLHWSLKTGTKSLNLFFGVTLMNKHFWTHGVYMLKLGLSWWHSTIFMGKHSFAQRWQSSYLLWLFTVKWG